MVIRSSKRPRPLPFRFIALFMTAIFLLAGAREGLAGYVCQQHEGHDHSSTGHAGHQSHDGHAHEAAQHGETGSVAVASDASETPGAEPCSCVGDCRTGETGARSNPEESGSGPTCSAGCLVTLSPTAQLPGAPEFFLPYSNGPPQLA